MRFHFAVLSVGSASALQVASPALSGTVRQAAAMQLRAGAPIAMELEPLSSADSIVAAALTPAVSAASLLLADDGIVGSIFGAVGSVFQGVLFVALVAIPLYYIYGVFILSPEEREEQGIGKLLADLTYAYTPSPWRKTYLAGTEEEEEPRDPLPLPEWASEEATLVTEPECVVGVQAMQRMQLDMPSLDAPLNVCYWSAQPEESKRVDAPPVMLVHGFDSSVLEFRFVIPALVEAGLEVHAMDWWTGGFTDREPFTQKLQDDPNATPWGLIREQHYAFWKKTCGGRPAIVLGASLGGAPTMDFAVACPEAVQGVVLMDSGGHSYAQPPPFLTSALSGPVSNFFAWRGEENLLPFPHLWRKEKGWREALEAYLRSGGYQVRANPDLIKQVQQKSLVLWGEADDVLPVEDAEKFRADLPDCAGVTLIPDAMHAPALENPAFVAKTVEEYVKTFKPAPAVAV